MDGEVHSVTDEVARRAISRRDLFELAVASLLVASGCATSSPNADLDGYLGALRMQLDGLAQNDAERIDLVSVARRIEIRSRELAAEHREFLASFDALMRERDVAEAQLGKAIASYSERRKWLRDDLLKLQDELHDALPPDDWSEVVKVLNRTGRAVGGAATRGA